MAFDYQAMAMGYDDGWFGRAMDWKEFTHGNPGYNRAWGSYKKGVAKGAEDRKKRIQREEG